MSTYHSGRALYHLFFDFVGCGLDVPRSGSLSDASIATEWASGDSVGPDAAPDVVNIDIESENKDWSWLERKGEFTVGMEWNGSTCLSLCLAR